MGEAVHQVYEHTPFHVLGHPRVYIVVKIDAGQLEYGRVGVYDNDIVEVAVSGVHIDAVTLRTRRAMDVGVAYDYLGSSLDPEGLKAAVAYHKGIEGYLAGTSAIYSSTHRIAVQDKIVDRAAMSYPVRDIKIVEVNDMLHRFDGLYYRSAEIHLDIGLRMNHYGFRNRIYLSFLGTQQTVMCLAVVESFLQTLGIIGDSVSNTAEDFRCNLQCILPVSRRASSLEGKARRNEKENGYQSFHNYARYKKSGQ